jgi:CRISPR-associated endonuclease/helicase Cas3
LLPQPYLGDLPERQAKIASWQIAGLINLADWIGSDQTIFQYEEPNMSMARYWEDRALPRARLAVEQAVLRSCPPSRAIGLRGLTGSTRVPSPLQLYAETVALPAEGPSLFLLEDMTGAGKTEAALILAHRLMLNGRGDGIFVALPTMATANAIYRRLATLYRRLFGPASTPSLALAHSAAALQEDFTESILEVGRQEASYGDAGDPDETASAACAAWIASDRRRAFFADVGVGTIDQAFLAVLSVKFAALRQLGLSRRILILDEVHAYQAYESQELCRLISFHAAAGGSLIALSATLPDAVKDRLVKAWCLGRGVRFRPSVWPNAYPLATQVDAVGDRASTAVAPRLDLPRSVRVERLDDAAAAIAAILAATDAGACVAWVRNTVDDAVAAFAVLRDLGRPVRLFHARFAMVDRQRIEADVMASFGVDSAPEQRRGQILIATQVVEQSLDLDFDLLISDVAPIDLLIQRAGRLWRHQRASRPLPQGRLLVVSPAPVDDAATDWIRGTLPGTSFVYRNHALLWQTAKVLFAAGKIDSPSGVRDLVEAVYGREALDGTPKGLERSHLEALGQESAGRSMADQNLLDWRKGYGLESGDWVSEVYRPTRLGEARTVFRLALWTEGRLQPWAGPITEGLSPRAIERLWALSEVALTRRRATCRGTYPPEIEGAAATLEKAWMDRASGAVVLPLLPFDGSLQAFVARGKPSGKNSFAVLYDEVRGVVWFTA